MAATPTTVKILNKSLEVVAQVKNFYPLNREGTIIRYSDELSDWGFCEFRVATQDPLLSQYGDILNPMQYNVWVYEGTNVVWKGIIIDNPERTKNYIAVKAAQYEFLLDRVLVNRDKDNPNTDDDESNFRLFKTGTLKTSVTAVVNEAITKWGANHPLENLTIGTVENPDYPVGMVNESGRALTGAWTWSNFFNVQFDYHSVFYVLKNLGIYSSCDFEITEDLVFNWQKFLGNKNTGITFLYGTQGNVVDYNFPRLGGRMSNVSWGICSDDEGKVYHYQLTDTASKEQYGTLEDAWAFSDVKTKNLLKTRVREQQAFTKTPEVTPISIVVDEKSYAPVQYGVGDIVTVQVKDHIIDYNAPRRIVGITVNIHDTGRKLVTIQTNAPKPEDIGA